MPGRESTMKEIKVKNDTEQNENIKESSDGQICKKKAE